MLEMRQERGSLAFCTRRSLDEKLAGGDNKHKQQPYIFKLGVNAIPVEARQLAEQEGIAPYLRCNYCLCRRWGGGDSSR